MPSIVCINFLVANGHLYGSTLTTHHLYLYKLIKISSSFFLFFNLIVSDNNRFLWPFSESWDWCRWCRSIMLLLYLTFSSILLFLLVGQLACWLVIGCKVKHIVLLATYSILDNFFFQTTTTTIVENILVHCAVKSIALCVFACRYWDTGVIAGVFHVGDISRHCWAAVAIIAMQQQRYRVALAKRLVFCCSLCFRPKVYEWVIEFSILFYALFRFIVKLTNGTCTKRYEAHRVSNTHAHTPLQNARD